MPEIKSAEEATDVALAFAQKHRTFVRPVSTKKEDGAWVVLVDTGVFGVAIGQVRVDVKTGTILEYEFGA